MARKKSFFFFFFVDKAFFFDLKTLGPNLMNCFIHIMITMGFFSCTLIVSIQFVWTAFIRVFFRVKKFTSTARLQFLDKKSYLLILQLDKMTKIPYLFRISWKFLSQSCLSLLDSPYGSFSQVTGQFVLAFPSLFLQCSTFWPVSIETEFDDQSLAWKCFFKMVQNCSMFGVFGWFCYPWDARNTICLALIAVVRIWGYFLGIVPDFAFFSFTIFVFFKFSLISFFAQKMQTSFFFNNLDLGLKKHVA